jgi:hypothetical protein
MKTRWFVAATVVAVAVSAVLVRAQSQAPQKTPFPMPSPGVPQIMTLEDQYVRVAYNNEGYAILGYRLTQQLIGKEWIGLEVGTTLRERQPSYALKRSDVSLSTPDGKTIPLPTNAEYQQQDLRYIIQQAAVINDSINYFPPTVRGGCRLAFFSEPNSGVRAFDSTDLSPERGCLGRLYFRIPGGLQYGQHFLQVKFANSMIRVPFRIFTKDEEKIVQKNWRDIKKQVEEAFKSGRGGGQ